MATPEELEAIKKMRDPIFGQVQGIDPHHPTQIIGSVHPQVMPVIPGGYGKLRGEGTAQGSYTQDTPGGGVAPGAGTNPSQAQAWLQEVGHGGSPVDAVEVALPQHPRAASSPGLMTADKDGHDANGGWQPGAEPLAAKKQGTDAMGLALRQALQALLGSAKASLAPPAQAPGNSIDSLMQGQKPILPDTNPVMKPKGY
jgi:hypothetical protein